MSFPDSLTTKKLAYRRVILKQLLRLYIEHSTIEEGLSLADVSTSLNSSRAQTEAVVETLLSEGYLYSTIDDEHHQTTCDEMPSYEQLSSLAASQGPHWPAPSATAPSTASRPPPAPPLRRELTCGLRTAGIRDRCRPSNDPRATLFDVRRTIPINTMRRIVGRRAAGRVEPV